LGGEKGYKVELQSESAGESRIKNSPYKIAFERLMVAEVRIRGAPSGAISPF